MNNKGRVVTLDQIVRQTFVNFNKAQDVSNLQYKSEDKVKSGENYSNISLKDLEGAMKSFNYDTGDPNKLSAKQLAMQVQILDNFMEYKNQARDLAAVTRALSPDTAGVGKNISDAFEKIVALEKVLMDPNPIITNVKEVLDKTFIGTFSDMVQETYFMYKDLTLTEDPKYKPTLDRIKETLTATVFDNKKRKKIIDRVNNDFILFSLMTMKTSKHTAPKIDFEKDLNRLFKGNNSVARRVQAIKKNPNHILYDNMLIKELVPIFERDTTHKLDHLKLFSRKLNIIGENKLVDSFREVFEEDPNLGQDLMTLSLMQSGIGNSPITFVNLIPSEEYYGIANAVINLIDASDNAINMELFEDQFYRNNQNLIPDGPWTRGKEFAINVNDPRSTALYLKNNTSREIDGEVVWTTNYYRRTDIVKDNRVIFEKTPHKQAIGDGIWLSRYEPHDIHNEVREESKDVPFDPMDDSDMQSLENSCPF